MNPKDTIDFLKKAIEESPKNVNLRLHLAQIYFEERKYKESLDEYLEVTSIDKNNKDGIFGVGKNLFYLEEYKVAIDNLKKIKKGESYLFLSKS